MTKIDESVAHLRTVHFSLLVVCFALFGLTAAGTSRDVDRALVQLSEIVEVLDRWEPEWLESAAGQLADQQQSAQGAGVDFSVTCLSCEQPLVASEVPRDLSDLNQVPFERELTTAGLHLRSSDAWTVLPLPEDLFTLASPVNTSDPRDQSGPLWAKKAALPKLDPQFPQPVPSEYPLAYQPLELAAPETLGDFEAFWNQLGRISLTVTYASEAAPFWLGIFTTEYSLDTMDKAEAAGPDWPDVSLRLEPMTEHVKAVWRDRTEHELRPEFHYIGYTPWGTVSVPATVEQLPLDAESTFIDYYKAPWRLGSFASNFPELSAATLDASTYSFDKLRAILVSESKRTQRDVQIFGLSISASLIAKWGGPIVLVIQLYFILHLRMFRQAIGRAQEIALPPWIGVYSDILSRTATTATAFVLPPVLLGVMTLPDIPSTPSLGAILALSIGLAAWSLLVMRDLWRLLDQEKFSA